MFQNSNHIHSYNLRDSNSSLFLSWPNTEYGRKYFRYSVVKIWNSIPEQVRNYSESFNSQYYFTLYYLPWICAVMRSERLLINLVLKIKSHLVRTLCLFSLKYFVFRALSTQCITKTTDAFSRPNKSVLFSWVTIMRCRVLNWCKHLTRNDNYEMSLRVLPKYKQIQNSKRL
jgi:hypothetical protein